MSSPRGLGLTASSFGFRAWVLVLGLVLEEGIGARRRDPALSP